MSVIYLSIMLLMQSSLYHAYIQNSFDVCQAWVCNHVHAWFHVYHQRCPAGPYLLYRSPYARIYYLLHVLRLNNLNGLILCAYILPESVWFWYGIYGSYALWWYIWLQRWPAWPSRYVGSFEVMYVVITLWQCTLGTIISAPSLQLYYW